MQTNGSGLQLNPRMGPANGTRERHPPPKTPKLRAASRRGYSDPFHRGRLARELSGGGPARRVRTRPACARCAVCRGSRAGRNCRRRGLVGGLTLRPFAPPTMLEPSQYRDPHRSTRQHEQRREQRKLPPAARAVEAVQCMQSRTGQGAAKAAEGIFQVQHGRNILGSRRLGGGRKKRSEHRLGWRESRNSLLNIILTMQVNFKILCGFARPAVVFRRLARLSIRFAARSMYSK